MDPARAPEEAVAGPAARAYSPNAIQLLRTVQNNTLKLSQMADQKAGSQLSAKDKAERCTKARERYDQYMSSQRLYSQDEKGQRTYLNDKELTEARANAKASMDALCQ